MLVKLIIKSPNLRYSDITLDCSSEWTVKDLKCHIQNNYPTKPTTDEQRLIYSGKLLLNTQVLGEVLRDLDEQENHTIHLVCSTSMSRVDQTDSSNTEGEVNVLRHRNVQPQNPTIQPPAWNNNNNTTISPDLVSQQILWWQQTFAQQYWTQYVQYMNTQVSGSTVTPAGPSPPTLNAPVPAPEEQGPAGVVLGPAEEANDENEGLRIARDWLDWTYIATRLAILMSFIYFYSSLSRFLIVVCIIAVISLYRLAVRHRDLGNEQAQRENNVNNEEREQENESEAANEAEREPRETSAFSLAVSLISGFFTSLIPEVPAPEGAVN